MRIVESKHIMNTKMARMMMGLVVGFLALAAGTAQAANYTNTLSGNWSDATRWPSSGAPASITDGNNVIVFNPTATDNSTNDNTGAFWLNQLLVAANQTVNLYAPGGNSLLFTNATGGALPALTNAGSSILTLNSAITLATNLSIGAAGAITINSNITDGALGFGFTKTGAGTLTLIGANTYTGTTTISAGTMAIGNGSNTTASAGTGVLTNGNSTLLFNFNGPVTLANSSVAAGGAAPSIQNIGAGKVTYTNNATATPYSLRGGNAGIVLVNQITGGGPNVYGDITLSVNNVNAGLSSWGSGCTLHFVGVNTAWAIGGAGGTPWATAPTLDIATSVTLAQNGSGGDKYYNNLTGAGNFTFQGQSSQYGYIVGTSTLGGTLQVGNGSGKYCSGFSFGNGGSGGLAGSTRIVAYTNVTFNSTTDNTYSGIMSGPGGLIKLAANTLTLTGTNTYSGVTTVSNGTLLVNGTATNTAIIVAGGTLGGTGMVGLVTVNSGGALSPGYATNTVGTLTATNLTVQDGAVLNWDFNATTADLVTVTGPVNVGTNGTVNLASLDGSTPPGKVTLFTFPSGTLVGGANLASWTVQGVGSRYSCKINADATSVYVTIGLTGTLLSVY